MRFHNLPGDRIHQCNLSVACLQDSRPGFSLSDLLSETKLPDFPIGHRIGIKAITAVFEASTEPTDLSAITDPEQNAGDQWRELLPLQAFHGFGNQVAGLGNCVVTTPNRKQQ